MGRVKAMAKGNGRLTAKSVSVWFEAMPFDGQVALLDELQKANQLAEAAVSSVGKWVEQRTRRAQSSEAPAEEEQREGEVPRP